MVGLIENLDKISQQFWQDPDDEIWLLGLPLEINNEIDSRITLAASSYLECIHNLVTGRPPFIDLDLEVKIQSCLRKSIANSLIKSSHDVSDGGLAVAIAESSIGSGLGVNCQLPRSVKRIDHLLFAESGSRIIISIDSKQVSEFQETLKEFNLSDSNYFSKLGVVRKDDTFILSQNDIPLINLKISQLKNSFENSIKRRIANPRDV